MEHRLVPGPAGRIHLVQEGDGPVVLLVHGFPEGWWTWESQLPALAAAGHRAVALDVRGYGRSSSPQDPAAYGLASLAEDCVAVLDALEVEDAVLVGHDWGSAIATSTALLHPSRVAAVALLGVPYQPRGGPRPTELFAAIDGPGAFYVAYLQEHGEDEIEPDVRGWLAGFAAALSADTAVPGPGPFFVPDGGRMRDAFPAARPAWLTDALLDRWAAEFERTGLRSALARYRNVDRDWEQLERFDGAPVTQPSLFVAGAQDPSVAWLQPAIDAFPTTLPDLRGVHLLEGCGHWLQHERDEELSALLVAWLADLAR